VRHLPVFLLLASALLIAPALAAHNVTFVNSADIPVWINIQGGPKGVCSGLIDPNTKVEVKCSACSMCPNATLCNTSVATGNSTPFCCPGVVQDQLYCWDKTQCLAGLSPHGCCPGIPLTAMQSYNCPGANELGGCANTSLTLSEIDALSAYNNATYGLHKIACNGSLIMGGGFKMDPGTQLTLPFDTGWQGAVYPRTNCTFDAQGVGTCLTGTCKNTHGQSVLECGGAGSLAPVTKGEFNFDDINDWYDVSFVDGFNIAMVIRPTTFNAAFQSQDAYHHCSVAGCNVGLQDFKSVAVPNWNILQYKPNGNFVGILSDCNLYSSWKDAADPRFVSNDILNGYCCPISEGYVNNSHIDCKDVPNGKTCKTCAGQNTALYPFNQPNALPNSARLFLDTCPTAYSYTYNDTDPLRECKGDAWAPTNYTITFSRPGLSPLLSGVSGGGTLAYLGSGSVSVATVQSPAAGEEMALAFNQIVGENVPVSLSRVGIVPAHQLEEFSLLAQPVELGEALQITGQPVAGYLEIEPVGVNSNTLDFQTITFSVHGSWLNDNHIAPGDVVLERYHDGSWNELPTTFVSQSGDAFTFDADTPGFSYFAVTVKTAGNMTVNGTSAATTETTSPFADTVFTETITRLPTASPVATATTEAATVPSEEPAFPAETIAVVIAGIAIIAGAAYLIRRWWIRRQNPALFRDM
jgi:hypothetical protein